ncbi:MAG: pyruvate carboxyltransferase [Peptococcaceae bacterium]|jgi:isopropylmalate/homocitrate/citramalate synthase|nr:pyruvate carboxyltransferase [Peptococcaceae bacterium]MDH7526274.1 pyruvate carboxyltransferase [Peptococcaceae bacterium]
MNTPWKTDKWFTSPWNFVEEVRRTHQFAGKIKFHDVSLRDGEQQARLVFNKDQKVALAEKLAEIGIHRIEAGMPAVSKQDAEAIKEIVKRNLGPEIFAFARCMKEDVKRAVDCGVQGIVVEIPSSEHIIKYAYRWELQKAIDLSIEATLFAKENGLYTVFFPIDGSRAEMGWFLDLIEKVAKEGHMDALVCVDTFGGLAPSASAYMIKKVKERIKDKPIEVHFHDDFGMGAANTVLALAAGADVAHTTISGIGERAGNAPYEDVALTLLTMYGVDTGLKYEKMYGLSKFLREMCGLQVRQNRGIIGDDIGKIESGIIAEWYRNAKDVAPLELSPYLYSLTGHPDFELVIGKNSGLPTVEIYLDRLGLTARDDDQKMEILLAVKEKSFEKAGLLTVEEFAEIANKVLQKNWPK